MLFRKDTVKTRVQAGNERKHFKKLQFATIAFLSLSAITFHYLRLAFPRIALFWNISQGIVMIIVASCEIIILLKFRALNHNQ